MLIEVKHLSLGHIFYSVRKAVKVITSSFRLDLKIEDK